MLKRFLVASILIFFTPSLVSACRCVIEQGMCGQAWKSGQVIFTGTVKSRLTTTTTTPTVEGLFGRNAFQFSVSESFRGPAIVGEEITVYTGMGGGDCGYEFEVGTSYVVYASLNDGKLYTNICTPTSPATRMRAIVRELRALQKGERVADLFGMIGTSPLGFADDSLNIKPVAGKQVRVIDSRSLEQSTTTDDEGVYSFHNLPADTYRIEVEPPVGMSTWQLNSGEVYKVDVGAQGGCAASLSFSANGRIEGIVVDEHGQGVAGFVTTELVDAKEAEAARRRGGTMGYDTENGEFRLWLLKPARYRLIFRPKIGGRIDFRVPPIKSEIITVGLGQHIEDFCLKVPAARP